MEDKLRDVVASNVNEEAVVLFGVTSGELMSLTLMTVLFTVPFFLFFGIASNRIPLFITLSLPVVFAVVALIALLMQKVKRGRPEGYFGHRMAFIKHILGIKKSHFILEHGVMSTMRTKQCILIQKHLKQDITDV